MYKFSWNNCPEHIFKETKDSMFTNEYVTEVECINCGVPGELDNKTQEVYYPAT